MTPGLGEILEYQLAAERLHDHPFIVSTYVRSDRSTSLLVFVNHVRYVFRGLTSTEVHDKAVRAFMFFNRLDRIRGVID